MTSRKRDREGSVEPSSAAGPSHKGLSTSDILPTKKNRLIEEELLEESAPDNEKVGQIRRRVEELSYDEREAKRAGTVPGRASNEEAKRLQDSRQVSTAAQSTPSPLSSRKEDAAPAPAVARTQPTFASFSSSSSPFASSSASSGVAGPSWLAGSSSSSASPFGGSFAGGPKAGGMSGTTGAIKPSALGDSAKTANSNSIPFFKTADKQSAASAPSALTATAKPSSGLGFGAFAASKPFATGSSNPLASASLASNKERQEGEEAANAPAKTTSIFETEADKNEGEESTDADEGFSNDKELTKNRVQRKDEAELATGEENERTVHSLRAKLYTMGQDGTRDGIWKERGTGTLRVNVPRDYRLRGTGARLVMRAEGVLRLILNVALFSGMKVELAQDKFIRFVAMEGGELQHFALRVSNAAAASGLVGAIKSHIPASPGGTPSKTDAFLLYPVASKATAVVFKDAGEEA